MTLDDRVAILLDIIDEISYTNSLLEKQAIIRTIPEELKDDFDCILECLSGVHKFGYTYSPAVMYPASDTMIEKANAMTIRQMIEFLLEPSKTHDLSHANISAHIAYAVPWTELFGPVVNRTMKIGIGKSLLPKDGLSAMLAKKYEGKLPYSKSGYYVTEKLDGNRCIARYDGSKWVFTSRNGKVMHVNFDMSNLPKEFVYDGEILSPEQCRLSDCIFNSIKNGRTETFETPFMFNQTSGLINRHSLDKKLVYNIFDIMVDSVPYYERRQILEGLTFGGDTKLVRILHSSSNAESLQDALPILLGDVTDMNGEGIMINLGDRDYVHKRTDGLFKLKKVQTIDMRVDDIQWGGGKYEGQVGALICSCITDDGKRISCDVGTGLSDNQRLSWAIHPEQILGKIVEVAYFSLSQDKSMLSTNSYSLRFPRLKGVRHDKNTTSEN